MSRSERPWLRRMRKMWYWGWRGVLAAVALGLTMLWVASTMTEGWLRWTCRKDGSAMWVAERPAWQVRVLGGRVELMRAAVDRG